MEEIAGEGEKDLKREDNEKQLTRREVIIKTGKYTAFTAAAMMMVLKPMDACAVSPSNPGSDQNNGYYY